MVKGTEKEADYAKQATVLLINYLCDTLAVSTMDFYWSIFSHVILRHNALNHCYFSSMNLTKNRTISCKIFRAKLKSACKWKFLFNITIALKDRMALICDKLWMKQIPRYDNKKMIWPLFTCNHQFFCKFYRKCELLSIQAWNITLRVCFCCCRENLHYSEQFANKVSF